MPTDVQPATDITRIRERSKRIEIALRKAARTAAIEHKRDGVPLVIWKDGQVVLVPPEDIEIPEEPE